MIPANAYPDYNAKRWLRDPPDGAVVVMDECGCCPLSMTKGQAKAWQWWHNFDAWMPEFLDEATPWLDTHREQLPF